MRLYALLLIGFFITLFGNNSYAVELQVKFKFQILHEKEFEKEIEEVVFDSYKEKGHIRFFPKVVITKELDEKISTEQIPRYKKEIIFLDPSGEKAATISNLTFSWIYTSSKGNFVGVLRQVPVDLDELGLVGIKESGFTVYNDKGEKIWDKKPFEISFDADFNFIISPIDGSVLYRGISSDFQFAGTVLFDSLGNLETLKPEYVNQYLLKGVDFSEDWHYLVIGAQKYPTYFYKELPGKSSEPIVLLFDSLLTLRWKNPIDEYIIGRVAISPKGSYIYASAYTMTGGTKGMVSTTGYLFNRENDLLKKIPDGSWSAYFSHNERYLFISYNPLQKTKTSSKKTYWVGLIDLESNEELFKKEFQYPIAEVSVSGYGEVAFLRDITPQPDPEYLEKLPTGEKRKYVDQLRSQQKLKVCILDKEGNISFESDEIGPKSKEIEWRILGWDKSDPILGVIDKENLKVSIIAIEGV